MPSTTASGAKGAAGDGTVPDEGVIAETIDTLARGRPVRRRLAAGGRLHVERPLPFICVHALDEEQVAARDITVAGASYLLAPELSAAMPLLNALAGARGTDPGGFLVIDIGELPEDRLLDSDSPWLPPFELRVSISAHPGARAAALGFAGAVGKVDVKYRSPRVAPIVEEDSPPGLGTDIAVLRIRFAPIYRVAASDRVYPELRERLVVNLFDAVLQATAAFIEVSAGDAPVPNHRALGRGICVDAVYRVDRRIDAVARSFEFLTSLTPINAHAAFKRFRATGFERAPRLLYRPLSVDTETLKHSLHAVRLEYLEDPVLVDLYREKQRELDLQITLLSLRDTPAFLDASRLLYGSVEPALLASAREILTRTAVAGEAGGDTDHETVGCDRLEREARTMIAAYAARHERFDAEVEIRDDMPAGMMVSGSRLRISRHTRMRRRRVDALLNHEIGVHLLTWFNGDAQGLMLFRSGLAGYEAAQEGLAVFAEHLAGDLSRERLRLVAARVVGCAAMLDGGSFVDVFRLVRDEHGFTPERAFHLTLRLFRSGGLAKDAIYLRGLLEILRHLSTGASLDAYWMGKIASRHLPVIHELGARGLLKPPPLTPLFLERAEALPRLRAAHAGLSPIDLITD